MESHASAGEDPATGPSGEPFDGPEEPVRKRRGRGKALMITIAVVLLLGAIAAGVWWAYMTFSGPRQSEVVGVIDAYFAAGARNDRAAAEMHIYMGEDAAALGGSDFSGEFRPEVFFGFRGVVPRHYFATNDDAYVLGVIEYNGRPSREFTAVLKRRADGNWGLLRLELSEPQGPQQASALVAAVGR